MSESRSEQLTARYQQLLSKKQSLEKRRIELETTLTYHRDEYNKSLDKLRTDFKVPDLPSAFRLRDEMELNLTKALDSLESKLSEFESLVSQEVPNDSTGTV